MRSNGWKMWLKRLAPKSLLLSGLVAAAVLAASPDAQAGWGRARVVTSFSNPSVPVATVPATGVVTQRTVVRGAYRPVVVAPGYVTPVVPYVAPTTTYYAPAYAAPTYTPPVYAAPATTAYYPPAYAAPTYVAPAGGATTTYYRGRATTTYYAPGYVAPAYVAPAAVPVYPAPTVVFPAYP